MNDIYKDVALFIRPLTAENILSINANFCEEDGFMSNQNAVSEIEPKLYSAYYYFLSVIYESSPITQELIDSMIPNIAGRICFYIASTQMFPTANKRTAAEAADLFLYANDFQLNYNESKEHSSNELADLMRGIGSRDFNKEQTISWFQEHSHKRG